MNLSLPGLFLATLGVVSLAGAEEPAILAKARAYLGTESALNGIRSVHWVGTGTVEVAETPGAVQTAKFDIIFQKPDQESLTTISAGNLARRVLDGFDGWKRERKYTEGEPTTFDESVTPLTVLGPREILSLRADAWENLSYYRGLEAAGGQTQDLGPATIDQVACEKISFSHQGGIVYTRYFDLDSGRLVFTESAAGAKIRERGEVMVDGVRFPKTIVTVEGAPGKERTTTMTIEKITLNESFPASMFAMPLPPMHALPIPPRTTVGPAANPDSAGSEQPASALPKP